jgi:hypothetical protein
MNKNRGEERRIVQPGTIASHLHPQQKSHQVSFSSPACNYNYPVCHCWKHAWIIHACLLLASLVPGWATDQTRLTRSSPACINRLDSIWIFFC